MNEIELKLESNLSDEKVLNKLNFYFKKLISDLEKDGFKYLDKRLRNEQSISISMSGDDYQKIWGSGIVKVFISHTSKHKKEAGELKRILSKYFISSFIAHQDIEPSAEMIIPLMFDIESCGFAGRYQGANVKNCSFEQIGKEVLKILFKRDDIKQKLANKFVELFVKSDNFTTTKEMFEIFKLIQSMPKDLINKIKRAYKNNNQVYKYCKAKNM